MEGTLMTRLEAVESIDQERLPEELATLGKAVIEGSFNGQTEQATERIMPHLLQAVAAGLGTGQQRLAIGEVLGLLGDPRLLVPADDAYWIEVPYEAAPIVIGRFPVTNDEFQRWVNDGGYDDRAAWTDAGWAWREGCTDPWPINAAQDGVEHFVVPNQPVVGLTFWEAQAYAAAHGARLPRQDERVWVCRGEERRPYPWGSPFGEGNANTQEEVLGRPCAVGLYVRDRTPEGVMDLAGNVAEWTADEVGDQRLIHPGAWNQPSLAAWAKAIELKLPSDRDAGLGFRLARNIA